MVTIKFTKGPKEGLTRSLDANAASILVKNGSAVIVSVQNNSTEKSYFKKG